MSFLGIMLRVSVLLMFVSMVSSRTPCHSFFMSCVFSVAKCWLSVKITGIGSLSSIWIHETYLSRAFSSCVMSYKLESLSLFHVSGDRNSIVWFCDRLEIMFVCVFLRVFLYSIDSAWYPIGSELLPMLS
jgi:hypothetical protein